MVSMGACLSPACRDCEENEYMDKYNKEQVCEQQPYCDPNSNFMWPESTSRTKRHQCLCKEGFHCSSSSCTTCVPHRECERGFGATTIGDQTHDTVCEPCPNGTFSDERSWNGACKKKTMCESGTEPKGGSSESDHECVPKPTQQSQGPDYGAIFGGLFGALLGIGVIIWAVRFFKRKYEGRTGREPQNVPTETDDDGPPDEEKGNLVSRTEDLELDRIPSQETAHSSPIQETEDGVRTANGHLLSQDQKDYVISQPETMAIC